MKRPVGRPPIPPELRKTHKRISIYPSTYSTIRLISKTKHVKIVDLIDMLIKNYKKKNRIHES